MNAARYLKFAGFLGSALLAVSIGWAEEGAANTEPAKPPEEATQAQPPKEQPAKVEGARTEGAKAEAGKDQPGRGQRRRGQQDGNAPRGGPGGGGQGGGPGGGGPGGGFGGGGQGGGPAWMRSAGSQMMERLLQRSLGSESPVKLDQIPYGADRRMVVDIPVGGVEPPDELREGWKVEEIFPATEEQTKSLDALRKEYQTELDGLQKKMDEEQAGIAAQVKELRKKYELRANDVLTGDNKAQKEKLDALAKEHAESRIAKTKDLQPELDKLLAEMHATTAANRDNRDWGALMELQRKGQELSRTAGDRYEELDKAYTEKMKEALTGDPKTKLDLLLEKIPARRGPFDMRQRRNNGGGDAKPNGKPDAGGNAPKAPPTENF